MRKTMNIQGIEKSKLIEAMDTYGGSFVRALGKALMCADHVNSERIYAAFPEIIKQYVKFAK